MPLINATFHNGFYAMLYVFCFFVGLYLMLIVVFFEIKKIILHCSVIIPYLHFIHTSFFCTYTFDLTSEDQKSTRFLLSLCKK